MLYCTVLHCIVLHRSKMKKSLLRQLDLAERVQEWDQTTRVKVRARAC